MIDVHLKMMRYNIHEEHAIHVLKAIIFRSVLCTVALGTGKIEDWL